MKTLIISLLVLTTANSWAQITLEHTYPFQYVRFALVDSNEVKYYRIAPNNTVEVFNEDHSLYKSISIPEQNDNDGVIKIQYLSRHLFNTDDRLELLCQTQANNTKIVNEDGQIIFERDKCIPNYPSGNNSFEISESVINTSQGTKLFLTKVQPDTTFVFSLPGRLPGCSTTKASVDPPSIMRGNSLPTSAYPNPSNGQMRISYRLPLGESTGELVILTTDGVAVKRYKVGEGFNDILVEKGDLSSGAYFYKLVTEKGESESKKLIILK